MRRTVLLSFLMIAASLSVVFGAGTFAPFTSTDTIAGTVSSGKLTIDLLDGDDNNTTALTFEVQAACGEMVPGEDCITEIDVKNDNGAPGSNLEFTYSGPVTETNDTDSCFNATLTYVGNSGGDSPGNVSDADLTDGSGSIEHVAFGATDALGNSDAHDPGEIDTFKLVITVDDDNLCQGKTATYTFVITGTQSPTPHD